MHSHFRGENHQHFSLRKLTVGVTSVLIGTTFMIFGGHAVHADDLSRDAGHENSSVIQTQNSQESEELGVAKQTAETSEQKEDLQNTSQVERAKVNDVESNQNSGASEQSTQKVNRVETISAKTDLNKNVGAEKLENKAVTLSQLKSDVPVKEDVHYNNPVNVSDWNGLTSALRNKNVDAIVLDNDINATGERQFALNSAAHDWQDWDIARKVTITSKDANKRNTINFGDHFISFYDQNHYWRVSQKNYTPWDITLKDINITNTNRDYSPLFFNNESVKVAQKDTVTFDNVEQNGDMLFRSEQANVVLKNSVTINSTLHNGDYNAIYARSVKVSPNANVIMNVSDTSNSWYLHGNAAIKIVGNGDDENVAVEVGDDAKLQINPNHVVRNTKGILVEGNGDVILAKNADVEMNMGSGNTTAIWGARNLILNEGSTLNIKTLQDNNGQVAWGDNNNGHHVSPISLGTNKVSWANNTLEIKKDATLRIVRENSGLPAIDGLISFGSYSSNARSKQNLLVDNGATLDLQDAAQSDWHEYGDKLASYLGNKDKLYTTGLISMYGIDATDNVHFGNARYVNLQRTGNQHGILLRLEGGSSIGGNSAVIDAKGMPLKQWIAGNYSKNADYSWDLDYLKTENKWGDYSYNYNGKNQKRWSQYTSQRNNGMTFDQSDGAVKFSDGKSLAYGHGDFNKMFNWWAPQRISFGTIFATPKASVEDVDALITHVNANTKVSPSLNVNNINFTWKDTDGNVVSAPKNVEVNWVVAPNTTVATINNDFDRTGEVEITVDGQTQKVVVPVKVLGATVKNDGAKVNQNDASMLPAAAEMTDTSNVNRFGIHKIVWSQKPDISVPSAKSYGSIRVDYSDGTSQELSPYVDVLEVIKGEDHKNDSKLYFSLDEVVNVSHVNDTTRTTHSITIMTRDRITDYAYPVGDSRRVTYTPWNVRVINKVEMSH